MQNSRETVCLEIKAELAAKHKQASVLYPSIIVDLI